MVVNIIITSTIIIGTKLQICIVILQFIFSKVYKVKEVLYWTPSCFARTDEHIGVLISSSSSFSNVVSNLDTIKGGDDDLVVTFSLLVAIIIF